MQVIATPAGAVASEMVYTIIETAKANGVNVYHYLPFLLENCPAQNAGDDELEKLAPWNADVRSAVEERAKRQASADEDAGNKSDSKSAK